MTLFSNPRISSSQIGAAVAEAILHDIRVNHLGLDGFPEIVVSRPDGGVFQVCLKFDEHSQNFELSNLEAKNAVQRMKASMGYDPEIFDRIQEALAQLEGAVRTSQ